MLYILFSSRLSRAFALQLLFAISRCPLCEMRSISVIAVVAFAAVGVAAQNTSYGCLSIYEIIDDSPPCVRNCQVASLQADGCDFTAVTCNCLNSGTIIPMLVPCLENSTCSTTDLNNFENYINDLCNYLNGTANGTYPEPTCSTSSATSSSTPTAWSSARWSPPHGSGWPAAPGGGEPGRPIPVEPGPLRELQVQRQQLHGRLRPNRHGQALVQPAANRHGQALVRPAAKRHGQALIRPAAKRHCQAPARPAAKRHGQAQFRPAANKPAQAAPGVRHQRCQPRHRPGRQPLRLHRSSGGREAQTLKESSTQVCWRLLALLLRLYSLGQDAGVTEMISIQ